MSKCANRNLQRQRMKSRKKWLHFHEKYANSIQRVTEAAIGQDGNLLCLQMSAIASNLSNQKLKLVSGFLIVDEGNENPLVLTHIWNQDKFGNQFDFSPWSDCQTIEHYVTRDQRGAFHHYLQQFPEAAEFFRGWKLHLALPECTQSISQLATLVQLEVESEVELILMSNDQSENDGESVNRQMFQMQSAFGCRSNQEMLDRHFGGSVQAMVDAVEVGETTHEK